MNRVVIWGTGQAGKMMLNLLSAEMNVVAFCDNNKSLHKTTIEGISVIDELELLKINPDGIYIAILNRNACAEVEKQIEEFSDTSMNMVYDKPPFPARAVFRKGYFRQTACGVDDHFACVSLDADLYQPAYDGLFFFYPRMTRGGYLILHAYNSTQFRGTGETARRFCRDSGIFIVPLCDLHGSAVIVKI